ncbi:hypothetical protein ABTX77_36415 [Streptomyces sp. NPDC097704]|uniref:hypothetical protein n=1 Tax=Streptomyces sp. NPDC097704 TaxID=3157101 RepID=UPI003327C6B6
MIADAMWDRIEPLMAGLVEGVAVRMAANHWPLVVDVHNDNRPDADHDCADLSQVAPAAPRAPT